MWYFEYDSSRSLPSLEGEDQNVENIQAHKWCKQKS